MKIEWSSFDGPKLKVEVLGEGCTWIPETLSFAKVSRGRFGMSKALGSESVHGTSSVVAHASKGRDSSYFGYFPF